ncbi:hypothetical protein ACP70R_042571 [Stipagrostis hirtigluma subsp. patula]
MGAASEPREVKLYGAWGSAHAAMARNALALMGVRYEYVEEDLDRKSEALLRLNPVHGGKVPVLVVDGRPLAESLVILEYVDEAWPDRDPRPPNLRAPRPDSGPGSSTTRCRRCRGRWCMRTGRDTEGLPPRWARRRGPFVHGVTPGLLDVILGSYAAGTRVLSAVSGQEIVEPDVLPRVHASVAAFEELAAGFGTIVPYDPLLARLLERKERSRASAT